MVNYMFYIAIVFALLLILIPLFYYIFTGNNYWYNWLILSIGVMILIVTILFHVLYQTAKVGKETIEKYGSGQIAISNAIVKEVPNIAMLALV